MFRYERGGVYHGKQSIFNSRRSSCGDGSFKILRIICLIIQMVSDYPKLIPVFIPFFILAAIPVLFRAEINHMSEIELATRNSYAQLLLARLIIIGAADIICFTVLLAVEICCFRSGLGLLNLILYVFVPYMLCVTAMLVRCSYDMNMLYILSNKSYFFILTDIFEKKTQIY